MRHLYSSYTRILKQRADRGIVSCVHACRPVLYSVHTSSTGPTRVKNKRRMQSCAAVDGRTKVLTVCQRPAAYHRLDPDNGDRASSELLDLGPRCDVDDNHRKSW
jgi:hypothetical protein